MRLINFLNKRELGHIFLYFGNRLINLIESVGGYVCILKKMQPPQSSPTTSYLCSLLSNAYAHTTN